MFDAKKLKELRDEFNKLFAENKELVSEDEGGQLRWKEEGSEKKFDENEQRMTELKGMIDRLEKLEERESYLDASPHEPVKPEGNDGKPAEKITVGEDRSKNSAAEFGKFLQEVRDGNPAGVEIRAASGQSEGSPSGGGFAVGTDTTTKIMDIAHETGILQGMCDNITISSNANSMKMPKVVHSSRADGSRPLRGYWTCEAAQKESSTFELEQLELSLNKLTVLVYVTDELLQDTSALGSFVTKKAGEEIGFKMDDAIINGSGAGMPLGVLNAPCLVSQAKEPGQTAATIVYNNLNKMYSRVWPISRGRGVWIYNAETEPELRKVYIPTGSGGTPVWMPAGGISGVPYATIFGRPAYPIEQCAALGTVGDIIFGDFREYMLATKGGIQAATSIHIRFDYDETAFRFVFRADGQPSWSSALTPYKGSATVSPFVALATRA